ncbi:hypothetical protein M427DRAFT_28846 [Gonapodya prolifera JEL478]|uniref:SH3 domain-containing protein n=1 Tax=Gonapodya prolifera (strain JEL478) TaxID=1344416 RepID=A0A139ARK0_GONPJ|nr:hypothetical protein M427DRAFT_28846 [Gonapodya prolifera JEL478]|eukprot:KXS19368.1 hypothetical protein M427DRAFT_28846 [Gonapodya prolifera JEL478]
MTDTASMRMATSMGMMSMSMMSTTTALALGSSTQTAVAGAGTNGVTGGLANNGLPFPAIIGIAAGSALGLGLLLFIPVWSAVKRNQKRKRDAELREVRESNFEKMSAEKKRPWPAPDSAMLSAAPLSSALPTAMAMFTPVGAAARRLSMESDGASDWGSEMNFPNRNASLALNGKKMGRPKSATTPSGRLGEPNLPPGFQPHWFFTKVAGAQNKMNHLSVQYNGPPFVVSTRHDPSAEDEIALAPGHMVDVRLVFKDGWATGTNLTTGNYGVLPLTSLRLDDSAPSSQLESARLDSRSFEVTSQVLSERRMMAPKGVQSNAPGQSFRYGPPSGFGSKLAIPSPDVNVRGPPSNFFPR